MPARAVFGVPVHDGAEHVDESLRSLLAQDYEEFAVVIVDDGSTDGTPRLLERHADDPRVTVERLAAPRGLIGAWRAAYDAAIARHPEATLFAWGSDHDVWEPRWLHDLAEALDANPHAVLAHPLVDAIDDEGRPVKRTERRLDTRGISDPVLRLQAFARARRAGDMVYGLYRVDALRRIGPFPDTVQPDRLLLARLALEGEFVQVPEVLWHRRYRTGVVPSMRRQRRALWAGSRPRQASLPWRIQHWVALRDSAGAPAANAYLRGLQRAVAAQRHEQRARRLKWARKRWRARAARAKRALRHD